MNPVRRTLSVCPIQLCFRRSASGKDRLIEYYSSTKQLFGPEVPKNKKQSKVVIKFPREGLNLKNPEPPRSSEGFWLFTNATDQKNFTVFKRKQPKDGDGALSSNEKPNANNEVPSIAEKTEESAAPSDEKELKVTQPAPVSLPKAKSNSNKDTLIEYYSSARQLFGPEVPESKRRTKVVSQGPIQDSAVISPEPPRSSEVFWLFKNETDQKRITVFKRKNASDGNSALPSNEKPNANHKMPSIAGPSKGSAIPFDDNELKALLLTPFSRPKATSDETNEALQSSKSWPSISKVLSATMSDSAKYALKKWKLAKIAELGDEGFKEYERMTFETGRTFHSAVENYLETRQTPEDSSSVIKLWRSVSHVLVEMDPKPLLTEAPIVHPHLKYKGIVDGLAVIK